MGCRRREASEQRDSQHALTAHQGSVQQGGPLDPLIDRNVDGRARFFATGRRGAATAAGSAAADAVNRGHWAAAALFARPLDYGSSQHTRGQRSDGFGRRVWAGGWQAGVPSRRAATSITTDWRAGRIVTFWSGHARG